MECHFHPLVQGFAKTDDAAAADTDACFLGTGYVLRLFLRCMGGAHFLEEGRCRLDIAVQAADARFFELVSLFLREESEGAAYFDAHFLADTTD